MKIRRILVPTDLSGAVEPAKRWASDLARRRGAEILLLHSVLTHEHDFRQLGELLSDFLEKLEREASAQLEKECTLLKKDGLVARYAVERSPSAFEAIRDRVESFEPDVVVMGTHGRSGIERWFIGSVAEKAVRHLPVPVVTIRPDARPQSDPSTILVPVDFSESSRRAVAAAAAMKGEGTSLLLLHVVVNPAFKGLHPGEHIRVFGLDPTLPDRLRDRMRAWMEDQPFEGEVRESDDVADAVLDVARERSVDLIVVGTRGLTGFDYFMMGSVAEKIVRHSPAPVLTVK